MTDQLWRTWAFEGLTGRPGLNVYAVSPRLRSVTRDVDPAVERAYTFDLPEGIRAQTRPEDVPTSMAFMTEAGQHILTHRVYVGPDGHGRWGNYFAHVLVGLPGEFTLRDAIRLWGSPFWQRELGNTSPGSELPEVDPFALPQGRLDQFILDEELLDPIAFLIAAYLTHEQAKRYFLVGPPEFAAAMITALADALPATMVRDLSFSTYEARPAAAHAQIVGVCGAPFIAGEPPEDYLLPHECGGDIIIDSFTGDYSIDSVKTKDWQRDFRLDSEVQAYGTYAAGCLIEGGARSELEEFVESAQQLGVHEREGLLVWHRRLQRAFSAEGLKPPDLWFHISLGRAPSSLARNEVRSALIASTVSNSYWWLRTGHSALYELTMRGTEDRRLTAGLDMLAEDAEAAVFRHMQSSEFREAKAVLDGILVTLRGGQAAHRGVLSGTIAMAQRSQLTMSKAVRDFLEDLATAVGVGIDDPSILHLLLQSPDDVFERLESKSALWFADSSDERRRAIVRAGLLRFGSTHEAFLQRLIAFYSSAVWSALEDLRTDQSRQELVLHLLGELSADDSPVRLANVLKFTAKPQVLPSLRDAAIDLVFNRSEWSTAAGRKTLARTLESLGSDVIERVSARPSAESAITAYLDDVVRQARAGVAPEYQTMPMIRALSNGTSFPQFRDRADALVKLYELTSSIRDGNATPNGLTALATVLEEFPELKDDVGQRLFAPLAAQVRRAEQLEKGARALAQVHGIGVGKMALRLLDGYLRGPGVVQADVLVGALALVMEEDGGRVGPWLMEVPEWQAVSRWLAQPPVSTGPRAASIPRREVAFAFTDLLQAWRSPKDEDLWLLFIDLFQVYAAAPSYEVTPQYRNILTALAHLLLAPPRYWEAWWEDQILRANVFQHIRGQLGQQLTVRRLMKSLAPPGTLRFGECLSWVAEQALKLRLPAERLHSIMTDVLKLIEELPPNAEGDGQAEQNRATLFRRVMEKYRDACQTYSYKQNTEVRGLAMALGRDLGLSAADLERLQTAAQIPQTGAPPRSGSSPLG